MRIVLDSTVLVRSHPRSRLAGKRVLNALIEGPHTLVLSSEIIVETIKVLRYPRLQKLFVLTETELYEYSQFLQNVSEDVMLNHPYHSPLRDAKDLHVMQTAEHGKAHAICSNDRDFHDADILAFCAACGIE